MHLTKFNFYRISPSYYSIQYGVTKISNDGDTIIPASHFVIHPDYNITNQYYNDLALLKLSFDLEFNEYVYPTVLSDSVTAGGLEATVVGWGLNSSFEGIVQEVLQEANIYTISNADCKEIHEKPIHQENICAMYPDGGRGQCNVILIIFFS